MLDRLCRLCGTKDDNMMNIFNELNSTHKILFKIHKVLQINIDEEDNLPTKICTSCIQQLENAFQFINYCHKTQIYLKKLHHTCYLKQGKQKLIKNISNDSSDVNELNPNADVCTDIMEHSKFSNISEFRNDKVMENNGSIKNIDIINIDKINGNKTSLHICKNTISHESSFDKILNKRKRIWKDLEFRYNDITKVNTKNYRNIEKNNDVKNEINMCISDVENYDNESNYFSDHTKDSNNVVCISSKQKNTSPRKQKQLTKFRQKSTDFNDNTKFSRKFSLSSSSCNSNNNEISKEFDSGNYICKELKEKKLSCAACQMIFTQKLAYEEHLNVHTGNRPFLCVLCEASFRKRQELNQHLRTVHSEKQFKCPQCEHIAKHKGKLTEHMKSVHEKPFVCDLCNYRTGEKGKITQHITNKHTDGLSYVCEICGNGFKTKNSLQTHRQNIHFPEPKVCQTCGTVCPSLTKYSAHIFRCGKEKKRYPCDKCGQTYVNKEILKDHMNKHLNIRPYKCEICGKEFFQRNRLDTHKYVHRGPVYHCEVCNQSFNRKDNMKNHMKKHFYKSMRYDNMIVTAV